MSDPSVCARHQLCGSTEIDCRGEDLRVAVGTSLVQGRFVTVAAWRTTPMQSWLSYAWRQADVGGVKRDQFFPGGMAQPAGEFAIFDYAD